MAVLYDCYWFPMMVRSNFGIMLWESSLASFTITKMIDIVLALMPLNYLYWIRNFLMLVMLINFVISSIVFYLSYVYFVGNYFLVFASSIYEILVTIFLHKMMYIFYWSNLPFVQRVCLVNLPCCTWLVAWIWINSSSIFCLSNAIREFVRVKNAHVQCFARPPSNPFMYKENVYATSSLLFFFRLHFAFKKSQKQWRDMLASHLRSTWHHPSFQWGSILEICSGVKMLSQQKNCLLFCLFFYIYLLCFFSF